MKDTGGDHKSDDKIEEVILASEGGDKKQDSNVMKSPLV